MDNREINLRRTGNNSDREDSPTMFYPIIVDKETLKVIGAGDVPPKDFHPEKQTIDKGDTYELWPIDKKGKEKNFYYSKQRVLTSGKEELFCKWVKGELNVYFSHSNKGLQTYKSFWVGSEYDAGAYGASLVQKMVNNKFPFPKSITTVLDCLKAVVKSKDALILDFFAGSGTTGHAVMMLNEEDGGNRKFILCTNNENNIALEITYPRIKAVINGYEGVKGIPANVRYFKTSFVSKSKVSDDTRNSLVRKSVEMICVRENTFTKVHDKKGYKIYRNHNLVTGVLFDLDEIDVFKEKIAEQGTLAHIYVFSLTNDTYSSDFQDLDVKHELCPIPESILEVYRKLFKD
jgi:adenine-specific DNA-methyltransferase